MTPKCNSLIFRTLVSKKIDCRDLILEIAGKLQQFSVCNFLISQNQIKILLKRPTAQIVTLLDNILITSTYTRWIQKLEMTTDMPMVTFRSQ